MAGLKIKLDPNERFYVNGALCQNGNRRSSITIMSPRTAFMREKMMISDDDHNRSNVHLLAWTLGRVIAGIEPVSKLDTVMEDIEQFVPEAQRLKKEGKLYEIFQQLKKFLPTKS